MTYSYDGLLRLIGATESPGTTYAYAYDLAGNRTAVWSNGVQVETRSYDAANQVLGWQYDAAGNLTNAGSATYSYDALNRLKQHGSTSYSYNGDGVLVAQTANSVTTRYTQDLAAPLSQILQISQGSASSHYLYGLERLAALSGSTRSWYAADALGSVRRTLTDSGVPGSVIHYDPWGLPLSGSVPTFGFTGELQDSATGLVYLRARWYHAGHGTFPTFRWDTRESNDFLPYSHHPYAYVHSNPILYTDPSGKCLGYLWGDPNCQFAGTDYTRYDYAGAGQVVVSGLGVAATVVACAGTAGLACAAGAAGAGAMTSWGNQALENAGQPVVQAATQVNWGRVGADAFIAGVSGPIGNGAGRLAGPLIGRIASAAVRATVQGSIIGATSSGANRFLTNLAGRLFGNSTTSLTNGVLESCIFGGMVGGVAGRLSYGVTQWWQQLSRARALQAALQEAERLGVEIRTGEEAVDYLNWYERTAGATPGSHHAVAVGDDLIYVRPEYATNVRVLREELLHVLQMRGGLEVGIGGYGINEAEIAVREALIQNASRWGLTDAEVQELKREIEIILRGGY